MPPAPERNGVKFTIDQATQDLLREAQELLGRDPAAREPGGVVKRELRLLVEDPPRRKLAATEPPRPARRRAAGARFRRT